MFNARQDTGSWPSGRELHPAFVAISQLRTTPLQEQETAAGGPVVKGEAVHFLARAHVGQPDNGEIQIGLLLNDDLAAAEVRLTLGQSRVLLLPQAPVVVHVRKQPLQERHEVDVQRTSHLAIWAGEEVGG